MSDRVKLSEFAAYAEETKGLERDYVGEVLKSRSMWQKVAIASLTIAGASVVAVMVMSPLKTVESRVIRVDNNTGYTEAVNTLADAKPSYGEAVDRYWLNQYVLNRESYDYNTIQSTYDATALLTAPGAQKEFFKLYEGQQGRDKQLKNSVRLVVTVKSIVPNAQNHTAVVRFGVERHHLDGQIDPPENWIATLAYNYVNAPTSETDRRVNPLGFQVSSYRVDPETVTN
jgi:type IV secretion system protein VirB8